MSAVKRADSAGIDPIYHSTTSFETLDYIPLVSTVSGIARGVFGIGETIVGAAVFPVQLIRRFCNIRHPFIFNLGVSNIVRGAIAIEPFVGNVILFLYDYSTVKKGFQEATGLI